MTRKLVSFTTHPDFVAVEKMYMAFLATKEEILIQKMISTFELTEQQAMEFFMSCAKDACDRMELMTPDEINSQIELINASSTTMLNHAN